MNASDIALPNATWDERRSECPSDTAGDTIGAKARQSEEIWRKAPQRQIRTAPRLADYVARYPLLGPVEGLPDDLIVNEYYARSRYGDRPTHAEYLDVFGSHHPDLAKQLQAVDEGMAAAEHLPTDLVSQDGPRLGGSVREFGEYVLLDKLGEGGMGVVFKAQHRRIKRLVAVKTISRREVELLTGERSFRGDLGMLLRQVAEDEAPAARKLNSRISRDLETVCVNRLEKSPARRYTSAADLGDDLRHFLAGEPIHARPVGRPERLWRWCKRQPVAAGLTAAVALSLVAGTLISSRFAIKADQKAVEADRNAGGWHRSAAEAKATRQGLARLKDALPMRESFADKAEKKEQASPAR
jgi:hypothetical protein